MTEPLRYIVPPIVDSFARQCAVQRHVTVDGVVWHYTRITGWVAEGSDEAREVVALAAALTPRSGT